MNKFYNMKIEINEQQPLDEVVRVLKSKGYWISSEAMDSNQAWCFDDGRVLLVERMGTAHFPQCKEITLTELRSMNI